MSKASTSTDLISRHMVCEFRQSSSSLGLTFSLALAFIYLVLAAQFESFRDPFIIMLTVPLSMAGALLALWLSGGTLNVYSQIGLVTLVGLITKHGILIVEFANQKMRSGRELTKLQAVVEAAEVDDAGLGADGDGLGKVSKHVERVHRRSNIVRRLRLRRWAA